MFSDYSGKPISKQLSSSLYHPSSLLGYQSVLRVDETGWLDIQVNTSHRWDRKWAQLKDGVFRYADTQETPSSSIFIPIENIIRLVTKDNVIVMKTKNEKLKMKTEEITEISRWIFSFQKSVALALMKIREKGPMSQLIIHDDYRHSINGTRGRQKSEDWTSEEFGGNGHGLQSQFIKTRTMMAQHVSSIADAKKSHHISPYESSDDSITSKLHRGKPLSEAYNSTEPEKITRAISSNIVYPQSPSAPTSPLRMNWNPNHYEPNTTSPERFHYNIHDERVMLGLMGDVVLPDAPVNYTHREISESSNNEGSINDPMGNSVESIGVSQTWRSVGDLQSLDGNENEKFRSRGQSIDSTVGFCMDGDDSDAGDRRSFPSEGIRLMAGYCSRLGPRSSNEDRCVSFTDLYSEVNKYMSTPFSTNHIPFYGDDRGSRWKDLSTRPRVCGTPSAGKDAYFAVYDGHAGSAASTFLNNVLHHSIYTHPSFEENIEEAISDTCINIDRQYLNYCRSNNIYSGTTAVGALVTQNGRKLTVFNIGDSEAILCRAGQAINLTTKHSPNREDESNRIKAAQGWITEEKELYYGRLHRMDLEDEYILEKANEIQWTYIHRVCGEISVSRSIGDIAYKGFIPGQVVADPFAWPSHHDQIFLADLVIPDPEFISMDLTEQDEFIILASDGLWDVVKRHEAVNRVKDLIEKGKTPNEICEELSALAIRLGSSDNVTIVIVQFVHD